MLAYQFTVTIHILCKFPKEWFTNSFLTQFSLSCALLVLFVNVFFSTHLCRALHFFCCSIPLCTLNRSFLRPLQICFATARFPSRQSVQYQFNLLSTLSENIFKWVALAYDLGSASSIILGLQKQQFYSLGFYFTLNLFIKTCFVFLSGLWHLTTPALYILPMLFLPFMLILCCCENSFNDGSNLTKIYLAGFYTIWAGRDGCGTPFAKFPNHVFSKAKKRKSYSQMNQGKVKVLCDNEGHIYNPYRWSHLSRR